MHKCAVWQMTNWLRVDLKSWSTPPKHYGFSVGLNHFHTDKYSNMFWDMLCLWLKTNKCLCQFALIYFSHKMAPLHNCLPTDITYVGWPFDRGRNIHANLYWSTPVRLRTKNHKKSISTHKQAAKGRGTDDFKFTLHTNEIQDYFNKNNFITATPTI